MNTETVIRGFKRVLEELTTLQSQKIEEYGIHRYREPNPTASMLMAYSDVYRKYIRLRSQILDQIVEGLPIDLAATRESFRDLANYGAMGVQLIDALNGSIKDPAMMPDRSAIFPIEQIALVATDVLITSLRVIGADHWHHDTVTTLAVVGNRRPVRQVADLAFNYQVIPGKELELIQYVDGPNFLSDQGIRTGLSHMGLHVNSIDEETENLFDKVGGALAIIQDAVTISHTNPAIKDTRRYRYRIFGSRHWLGFDLKFIQRHMIVPGATQVIWDTKQEWMTVQL